MDDIVSDVFTMGIKESGVMKSTKKCIFLLIIIFVLCGCGTKERSSITEQIIHEESDITKDIIEENEAEQFSLCEAEDCVEEIESKEDTDNMKFNDDSNERITLLYKTIQKMIDETDEVCFQKPDYFGTEVFTEDKFEEIKQYEMNIVLDYLGLKHWNRPTGSQDELGLPVDEPLGRYSADKLAEYTDEEHDLTIEYFCGGCLLHNLHGRYIALIIKEYKENHVEYLYYQIIDYGYLGVMTGSNHTLYELNEPLEEINIGKIISGDIDEYTDMWLDEDSGEVNLIYNIGKEEREGDYATYTSYAQSVWVILDESENGYKVKEIIPMRLVSGR